MERGNPLPDHLHANYKEAVFVFEEFEIATKHNLTMVRVDSDNILYKDKIETTFSMSK